MKIFYEYELIKVYLIVIYNWIRIDLQKNTYIEKKIIITNYANI